MTISSQPARRRAPGPRSERPTVPAGCARMRLERRLIASGLERVAYGVWLLRGGFPTENMSVYLLEDDGGVTLFDAGTHAMARAVTAAGASMGGIRRVVLGHAHHDHRGCARQLGVPVYCHPGERDDAEGDAGEHYFRYETLHPLLRWVYPALLHRWDGGPVEVAGTVEEGDEVAGFRVVHLPGHAPGMIALWRESDRLALTSDCFYVLDPQTGIPGPPRVPHRAFNHDTEQARASIRKLAELEPVAAWPGHADPVTGDVRRQLERAAETT
jgi:hydroxyacylglutathione hydrolase